MTRTQAVVCACLFALQHAVVADAQVIHGHPQKAAYGSPAEYPFLEFQGHWEPGSGMAFSTDPLLSEALAHSHVGCDWPIYAELTNAPITLACRQILFHTAGYVEILQADLESALSWDAPPTFQGDPMGVVTNFFHLTLDPLVGYRNGYWQCPYGMNPHGWTCLSAVIRTRYNTGALMDMRGSVPVWSNVDPTVAEIPEPIPMLLRNEVSAVSPADPAGAGIWGAVRIEVRNLIPLAPIDHPWTLHVEAYNYANRPELPNGQLFACWDMDLHNGIACVRPITPTSDPSGEGVDVVLDPSTQAAGAHKVALVWAEATGDGNAVFAPQEELSGLLVLPVTVGTAVPPPPPTVNPWQPLTDPGQLIVCTDPAQCGSLLGVIWYWNPTGYRVLGPFHPF
jgi:hypothetical protein